MMMSRNVARSAVAYVSPRFFSTATVTGLLTARKSSALIHVNNPSNGLERKAVTWISFPVVGVRNGSSMASGKKEENEEEKKRRSGDGDLNDKAIISYWGIEPGTVTKEDGTKWEWSCFKAIHSYTEFLKEIDNGNIENLPAPAIAIDYWRLPPDATFRDVLMVVRVDEAHHRDVNHFASDIHYQGHELKEHRWDITEGKEISWLRNEIDRSMMI